MTERHKPHNGRDRSGHFRVKREDVEALETDPRGEDYLRDDVRLGGAVEDIGPHSGEHGERIGRLVRENREIVERLARSEAGR